MLKSLQNSKLGVVLKSLTPLSYLKRLQNSRPSHFHVSVCFEEQGM